jgi:ABC-2 type transport system ATP-binding protein
MIVANHLTRKFGGITAVDAVDFNIQRGQVVGFLGPNGAGKTTTIRMIAGFLTPTSGSVKVAGLEVSKHPIQVARKIGYLPEAAPLYTEMRVAEFLKFRAKIFGLERAKRKRMIEVAIRRCWLDEVKRRPIHQLSKGYRQRVGLAAALLHQPPVLILDEPTVGLDPSQIREVRTLLRGLAEHHAILLSTHILPEVELTCDRIIMIARGRIHAQGSIDDLRAAAAKTSRYVIETDNPHAQTLLNNVSGIAEVDSAPIDHRWKRLTVTATEASADLREPIAKALAAHPGVMRELQREAPSLEQMFVQIVAQAEGDFARRQRTVERKIA